VDVALVAHVKHDLVIRRVEHIVHRHRQLHHTQAAAQVAAGLGHFVDHITAQLLAQLLELLAVEVLEVHRVLYRVQQGGGGTQLLVPRVNVLSADLVPRQAGGGGLGLGRSGGRGALLLSAHAGDGAAACSAWAACVVVWVGVGGGWGNGNGERHTSSIARCTLLGAYLVVQARAGLFLLSLMLIRSSSFASAIVRQNKVRAPLRCIAHHHQPLQRQNALARTSEPLLLQAQSNDTINCGQLAGLWRQECALCKRTQDR